MKNINSTYFFSQTFPNGSGSRFVFQNIEKKEIAESDFKYAEAMLKNETKTGVDLVGLDTEVSTQIESKEKLKKFNKFSKLVHKKINEKYSAAELKDLSEEQLKAKMEEMAHTFEHDPDISNFWKKRGKDMVIPNDLQQWLGLSGLAGFMVAVGSEGKTGPSGMNATSARVNKLTKGIFWGIIAAVATHPFITNGLALGMRKVGKNMLYPTASVAVNVIDKVSFDFGGLVSDPVGSLEEVWTGKDKNERAHDKMVMNYASGQAEVMTQYAGDEIKGWQGDIVKYKGATTDIDKNTIAETLIPETAEFVARSMPQFLGPVELEQVVRAIEAGNTDAISLSRYSAMIFSGNYFKFFLKEADPRHRKEFLKKFKESRAKMERNERNGYTKEELQSKFSGISSNGLKLNKILKKTGIRKALSKPGSSLLAIYLSIWGMMKLFMGGSNTLFNKQWWSDTFNSKGARGLAKAGSMMVVSLTSIDTMVKGVTKNKAINNHTIKKGKGLLSPSEAKKWEKALSSREDQKEFVKRYKAMMKKEKVDGKKDKKDKAEVTIEELQACLPEGARKELYPEDKE